MRTIGLTVIVALAVAGMLLAAAPAKTTAAASKPVTVELWIPHGHTMPSGYPSGFNTVTSQYATSREAYAATRSSTAYMFAATRANADPNFFKK